jgi:ABC-type sugar transport system permease subunit
VSVATSVGALRRRAPRTEAPQRRFTLAVLAPALLYLAAFTLLPLVWVFALSLFDYSPRRDGGGVGGLGGDNPFVGLSNFAEMFDFSGSSPQATTFQNSVKITLIFPFVVLPLNLMITLPLAAMIEAVARPRTACCSSDLGFRERLRKRRIGRVRSRRRPCRSTHRSPAPNST